MKWIQAVVAVGVLVVGIAAVTPMAAQPVCLHGTGELPEQAARRKQALSLQRDPQPTAEGLPVGQILSSR